jgi:DNA-binding YbaB/EbfC family protein
VFPGGQPDMQQLLKQAQKMQQQLADAQEELAQAEVQGSAGGGLVTATVSGTGELIALTISPDAIDPDDPADTAETVADLVLAAVRDASRAAAELQANAMGPLTGGLGGPGGPGSLGLPGF